LVPGVDQRRDLVTPRERELEETVDEDHRRALNAYIDRQPDAAALDESGLGSLCHIVLLCTGSALRRVGLPEECRHVRGSPARRCVVPVEVTAHRSRWPDVTCAVPDDDTPHAPVGERRPVDAQVVRPLRMGVLRPGRPAASSVMPLDDHPLALHVATYLDAEVVSVGSVLPDPPPWSPGRADAWRVRGMATRAAHRGHRHGQLVLEDLIAHARRHGGSLIWCNARVAALAFYERAGFAARSEAFDAEGVEHIAMWRPL
jgi:GNAT superfamily N-acetyltransferase